MALPYTPTAQASLSNNPPQGATPSTSQAKPGVIPFVPGQPAAAPPAQQQAKQDPNVLVTNRGPVGNFVANVSKAGKNVFSFLTGSENAAAQDITAALPGSATGVDALTKTNQSLSQSETVFIQAMNAQRQAGKALTPAQQQMYSSILTTHAQTTAADLTPAINKSKAEVIGDFAGTAADILGAGSYSKAGLAGDKAFSTGLTKAAPTAITAAQGVLDAAKGAVVKTPEQIATAQVAKIADTVAPKLTARETAEAIATRGATKSGFLGTIKLNTDPAVQRIAQTVQQYVPGFDTGKSLAENIGATKTAISDIATKLKQTVVQSGQDRIYSFKELGATLRGLEKPTLLQGDLGKAYDAVVNKALEIARSNGGKVSDLFQARKEFDQFVERQFPNLYSSDTLTPMRLAVKNVRNAITDFTAEHLPASVGLRDALTVQSRLIDAVENMSAKAASGAQKEVGTNALQRAGAAVKNHPVAGAFGGVVAYEAAKKLPIVGNILP